MSPHPLRPHDEGHIIKSPLAPLENLVADRDPASLSTELAAAALGALRRPGALLSANGRFARGSVDAVTAAAARAVGRDRSGPATPDKRFADAAYRDNAGYYLLAQEYLLVTQLVEELLDAADLPQDRDAKARFAARFLVNALSPTNNVLGNPASLRTAFDTGGRSLVRGARNLWNDLRNNGGWPSQVDTTGYEVGVNMASTPGSVIYRSELIEIIHYAPQTEQVHEVPLLFCPPWINKYYIMDLAPDRSLIEWALRQGHNCFAISYRNPDASMRDVGMRDYLFDGPLDAIRVVREITGAPEVNLVSVCLGGTLTAMALAHLAAEGDGSVASATFLNTHTDFTQPGVLGTFTDEKTVTTLERQMAKKGYLDASTMARTFDALRANDLIFSYVANNWLLGKQPPSFDLLAWNADSTRMPARMHSEYLRSCYVGNEFARGEFEVNGRRLDPSAVEVDSYILAAVDDHIVPWTSGYRSTQVLGGKSRFVLSTSGHIAGIVNPPSPKAKHWTNDALPVDPQEWKAEAQLNEGTWWNDWTTWIAERGGDLVPAPARLGSDAHPVLEAAPGKYVRA